MLSKHILTAKSMIIRNLKIQMLAGKSFKMCVSVSFEISLTLVGVFNQIQSQLPVEIRKVVIVVEGKTLSSI